MTNQNQKHIQNQNSKDRTESQELRNISLAVALIIGFIFIVSLAIYIIKEKYSVSCTCNVSLPFIIAILASLGIFVGIFSYYILSKSVSKEKAKISGNIEKTLNFLEPDEKTILSVLIDNDGEIAQNKLAKTSKLEPVKLHRRLRNLESKKIICKEKSGMTNKIMLNDEFKKLFIK